MIDDFLASDSVEIAKVDKSPNYQYSLGPVHQ